MQSDSEYVKIVRDAIVLAAKSGSDQVHKEHIWLAMLDTPCFKPFFNDLDVDEEKFRGLLHTKLESLGRFSTGQSYTEATIPFSSHVQDISMQQAFMQHALLMKADPRDLYPSEIFYSMVYQRNDAGSQYILDQHTPDQMTLYLAKALEREKAGVMPVLAGEKDSKGQESTKDWYAEVRNKWYEENLPEIKNAFKLSALHKHARVQPEHLWSALLDSPEFCLQLALMGVNIPDLHEKSYKELHNIPISTVLKDQIVPSKETEELLERIQIHSFNYEESFGSIWLLSLMLEMENNKIGAYIQEKHPGVWQNLLKYSSEDKNEAKPITLENKIQKELMGKGADMQVQFDEKAVQEFHPVIQESIKTAYQLGHEEVKPVHIWNTLLGNRDFVTFVMNAGVDYEQLRNKVSRFIATEPSAYYSADENSQIPMPELTQEVRDIDEFARDYAAENGRKSTYFDILNALYTPEGDRADRVSKYAASLGMKPEMVEAFTSNGLIAYMRDNSGLSGDNSFILDKEAARKEQLRLQMDMERKALEKTPLGDVCENLVWQALNGKIDPVIGMDEKLDEVTQTLAQYKKPNVMLLAEPGVGKTATAEGLAYKIAKGDVPEWMLDKRIYSLSVSNLTAGTRYRGDMEERIKQMVEQLSEDENAILFIDEIHMLNSSLSGDSKVADALKPALSRGAFKCIGATTFNEYRKIAEDGALMRRFQNVYLDEPSAEVTIEILKGGLRKTFEDYHNVTLGEGLVEECVSLADRYIMSRFFPDKAIDVLDKACAIVKCREDASKDKVVVDKAVAREAVEVLTHVKIPDGSLDETQRALNLESNLKKVIFGQDHAVEAVCNAEIKRVAGFKNPDKPNGSYVFDGATGVGKTELTKQLGKILERPVKRFDMSEFMEKHSVAKLIGTNPGYVGYEQGGLLTDAVERQPNMILLLDEVEKAHPDIFNVLLQVLDHGKLTDGHGKTVDFRNVTVIMTTNLSKKVEPEKGMGFGNDLIKAPGEESGDASISGSQGVNSFFSPEFRNRLDAVISFNDLTNEIMPLIAEKTLSEAGAIFKAGGLTAEFTQSAVNAVVSKGANKSMGARPMRRFVENNIIDPIALAKLKKEFTDQVVVDFVDGKFTFNEKRVPANDMKEGVSGQGKASGPAAPKAI